MQHYHLPRLLALILGTGFAITLHADDSKLDGKWTWVSPGRNGGADRTNVLALKVEGAKLTGKVTSPGRDGNVTETAIADGKLDGDALSFVVVREFNGNSVTNLYSGKLAGDKLTGKIEFTRDGQKQTRDWEARR